MTGQLKTIINKTCILGLALLLFACVLFPASPGGQQTTGTETETKTGEDQKIPEEDEPAEEVETLPRHKLHVIYMLEYLKPNEEQNPWKSLYVDYYGSPSTTFNYFIHLGSVFQEDGNDYIGIIGAARDWTPWFYTYTALVSGTKSSYLPKFRFDQDFNFKFGKKRNLVWTIGMTYIDYYHEALDVIFSSGLTLYTGPWVLEYRLFQNHSHPGNIVSYTHLGMVGFGKEKKHWSYLTVSSGSQAYLALHVLVPQEVRQDAFSISLMHQQWLRKNFGFTIEFEYLTLKSGFDKYGIYAGIFFEF